MIEQLIHALETDEEYRETWIANISSAVMDEAPNVPPVTRRAIAIRFLGWLCVAPQEIGLTDE